MDNAFSNRPVNWHCKSPHLAGGTDVARDGPLPRLSKGQVPIGKGSRRRWQIIYTKSKEDLKKAVANPPPNKLARLPERRPRYERGVGWLDSALRRHVVCSRCV